MMCVCVCVQKACEKAVGTMQAVLQRTLEYSKGVSHTHTDTHKYRHRHTHTHTASDKPYSPETMELRLVQSKRDIETPPTLLAAK